MKLRNIAAAALALTTIGANAALTTYAPWDTFFPDSQGLDGVLFNVQSGGGVTVAMGAHAYKNGVFLPNDGVDTFYGAQLGLYETNRANWSFDFAWSSLAGCTGCTVWLGVDIDPTTNVNFAFGDVTAVPQPQSWNMRMPFITAGYDFDVNRTSSTAFRLEVRNAAGQAIVGSTITVNTVPEPGSLALAGLALAGLAGLRRRQA